MSRAKALKKVFRQLDSQSQNSVMDFAVFLLSSKKPQADDSPIKELQLPIQEIAPESESVIGAIKRLRRIYPMLDTNDIFNESSALVSAHVMQGRPVISVINDLETLFDKHYQIYAEGIAT